MFKKAVFPGKYIQGVGAIGELPALIGSLGGRGLILASPSVHHKVLPTCGVDWGARGACIEVFRGECCEDELSRLTAAIAQSRADVLVGMGGGKAIDTAKIAADRAGLPVIVVPTIASTDAPTSGCAVIYSSDGVFDSVCYQRMNPAAVLVDRGSSRRRRLGSWWLGWETPCRRGSRPGPASVPTRRTSAAGTARRPGSPSPSCATKRW